MPGTSHPDLARFDIDWHAWNRGRRQPIVLNLVEPPRATVRDPEAPIVFKQVLLEVKRITAPVPYVGPPLAVWWWALVGADGRWIAAPPQTVEYHWNWHDRFLAGWPEPDPAADWFRP